MTLQLHLKISTRYDKLNFQLGLANLRWNWNPGWRFQIFLIIDIFSYPGWKFDTTHAWIPCLFLKNWRWRLHKDVSNGLMTNLSILENVYKNWTVRMYNSLSWILIAFNSGHFRGPSLVAVALEVTVLGRFYYMYIFY